ncbi:EamA family transporter [Vreelandella rituensis]|uniref:Drug/metabolite transporter n=1 Tax=Vreelandella rituensis TaxID=2282306 RepID=A0A368TRY9_9GAMM|nr:EamA family transporter [Halomonas rituensis]RCV85983.1 drug/metabolite transporter [Halomonas rituensis]
MSPTALTLIVVSVCLHAGWNVLGKRRAPSLAFFSLAIMAGGLTFLPLLLLGPPVTVLPGKFWAWLVASGLCQMFYMGGLAWAYARGEVSVLYPIVRALPVVFVPLVSVALLGSQAITSFDVLGMGLIVLGALCLPLSDPAARRLATYFSPALGFALLAAVATMGYSLIDHRALVLMQQAGHSAQTAGAQFMVLQALVTLLWALPLIACLTKERRQLPKLWQSERQVIIVTGWMITGTYGLVLVALALTKEVSYVVALRQLSIPLGALIGILWLKERLSALKALSLGVMVVGLGMVAY